MLRELHISNLAVIEDARISFGGGLNVITGQTGAGKSLLLGAFQLLLGLRPAGNLLRRGASEGRVSGVFDLNDILLVDFVISVADLNRSDLSVEDPLLITRKIFSSGRSSVSINGRPATLAMLRKIGNRLIDLQGTARMTSEDRRGEGASLSARNETLLLLKPSYQLDLVDHFADNGSLRAEYATAHRDLQELRQRKAELETSASLRRDQIDLYRFQADEIDSVDPTAGEFEEVQSRYRVLANMERLIRESTGLCHTLYEGEASIAERLQLAAAVVRELSEVDEGINEVRELTEQAAEAVQDASFTLSRYLNRLEFNSEEFAEVTNRLNALNRIIAKYGQGTIDGVFEFRLELERKLGELQGAGEDLDLIDEKIASLKLGLSELAEALRKRRVDAVQSIKPDIGEQLRDLAMEDAEFDVAIEPIGNGESPSGGDRIEFLIRTNVGQPILPLREIASGGELSRIMLAIKSVLAESERISILVFDEIDAKIGGRLGSVIGSKLRSLARNHQVLCITHLPQIAAYADRHLKIRKESDSGETRTIVVSLDGAEERIAELAEMFAGKGVTETTLAQSRELLDKARSITDSGSTVIEVRPTKKRRKALRAQQKK